jgi:hypothetical protein
MGLAILNRIIYSIVLIFAGYLYSLKSDYLYWGDSKREGLYLLALFVIVAPLLVISASINYYLNRTLNEIRIKFDLFVCLVLILLPAILSLKSQKSIILGFIFSVFAFSYVLWFIKPTERRKNNCS